MSSGLPPECAAQDQGNSRGLNPPLPFGKSHTIPISRNNAEWYFSRANLAIDRLGDALRET